MLDIKLLRESPQEVSDALDKRGYTLDLIKFNELDTKRKTLQIDVEFVQSERKRLSAEFANLKKAGTPTDDLKNDIDKINDGLKSGEEALKELQIQIEDFLLDIPNIPHSKVPLGTSEEDNVL